MNTAIALTWEQKLKAIQSLCLVTLFMRTPGDWCASARGIVVRDRHFLKGIAGNGITPEAAAEDFWARLTELPDSDWIEVERSGVKRGVRWNGFMWADVPPERTS